MGIDQWCDDPDDHDPNPLRGITEDVSWPAAYDATALTLRRSAVDLVSRARAGDVASVALSMDEAGLVDGWDEESRLLVDELRREQQQLRLVSLPRRLSASQLVVLRSDPDELAAHA